MLLVFVADELIVLVKIIELSVDSEMVAVVVADTVIISDGEVIE